MNKALLGGIIFVSVSGFVGVQTWLLNRIATPDPEAAAREAVARRPGAVDYPPRRLYTPFQVRLYVASWVVPIGLIIAGWVVGEPDGDLSGLSRVLFILGIAIIWVRIIGRFFVLHTSRRANRAMVAGQGDVGT